MRRGAEHEPRRVGRSESLADQAVRAWLTGALLFGLACAGPRHAGESGADDAGATSAEPSPPADGRAGEQDGAGGQQESPPTDASEPARERPRFELEFEGNLAFTRRQLEERCQHERERIREYGLTRATLDDIAYTVEHHYRTQGYAFAATRYEWHGDGAVPRGLVLIDEGPRVELTRVTIGGLEELSRKQLGVEQRSELERFFQQGRSGFMQAERTHYVASRLEREALDLERYLIDKGFLEARVGQPEVEFSESRAEATAHIVVVAGAHFRFAAIEVAGATALDADQVEALTSTTVGAPYSARRLLALRARLVEACRVRGYPDARIVPRTELSMDADGDGKARVELQVELGDEVTISEVLVRGAQRTSADFIKRRIELEPGARYDARLVREANQKLFRTGLFSRLALELEGDGAERSLIVEVEEAPAREVWVEPSWGSYEGFRLLYGGRHKNLFGSGKRLSFDGKVGQRATGADLSLSDPFLMDFDIEGTASLFLDRREEPSFSWHEAGVQLGLEKRWTPIVETHLAYSIRATDVFDVTVSPTVLEDPDTYDSLLQSIDIGSLATGIVRDTRDNPFNPERGSYARAVVEWADDSLGSELDFLRLLLGTSRFARSGRDTILAATARMGWIEPTEDGEVIPLQERFFNGGENSVRSFSESQLGPKDADGDPVGGETYEVLSVELRRRLAGNLWGAAFVDSGNVGTDASQFFKFENQRHAIGLGIRYLLPIGPVRLDVGYNPDAREDEEDWAVHFAVGLAF